MLRKLILSCLLLGLIGCGSTQIIESPKTIFVVDSLEGQPPKIIWSSRTLPQQFNYLGKINVRSLTYDGAMNRLMKAGQQLKADALIDVHYEPVGFLTTFSAFAVKFKQ